jgi:GNAT superfamily N-acetyltransferase
MHCYPRGALPVHALLPARHTAETHRSIDTPGYGGDRFRALLQSATALARSRGADHMDLGTSDSDIVARGLYESLGFSNREGKPDGPVNYFYEREL